MESKEATAPKRTSRKSSRRYFTVAEAESTLVLVRRIVRDLVQRHDQLMQLRDEIEALGDAVDPQEKVADLRTRGRRLTESLNELHAELTDIGCELKDWTVGLVDFPAIHDGREVLLCWRLDEPSIRFWHELDGGFTGRRPIDSDFGSQS